MKKIIPEYAFTQEQLNTVSSLAYRTDMTENIVRILYARGVDTPEKIRRFMNPSKENFLDPFLMRGMREAVEMITAAREEGKTVAVFGDYDADGVCALTILYHALKEFGIEPYVYVPERVDGYGLSEEAVDKVFEDCQPELFITVDCGISCAKEAQYIYELGADVIITDHHELPEVLPDCVIVNPKLKDDYPYDNLCGAGVAFKLACALLGERAYKLLDFAALATVADSVPLLGENRDIVTEGLKLFNRKPRLCFSALLGKEYDEITAQTLAFIIAPRVNAAGRMGDARSAFELFVEEDGVKTTELAVKLCAYNLERQKCCDELYLSAKEKLKEKGAYGRVIMLVDENWNSGFVGIVAAKIAEEYNRPTLLFVKNGNMLKGSARSIESVNIFTTLKNCSAYIEEFGGHAQAAGIHITEDNFDVLEKALNEEIEKNYTAEDFEQRVYVCEFLDGPFSEKFAHELDRMEPYGVGHRRPLFALSAGACAAKPVKYASPHLSVRSEYIDLMYFSGAKHLKIIQSDVQKSFVFDINVSRFKGKEYIKGFIRDIVYDAATGKDGETEGFYGALLQLKGEDCVRAKGLPTSEIKHIIREESEGCPYGLCMIASERSTLEAFEETKSFGLDLFYPATRSLNNLLLLSPAVDVDFSGYRKIVFLDTPPSLGFPSLAGKEVYYNKDLRGYKTFLSLNVGREFLLEVYASIKRQSIALYGYTPVEIARNAGGFGFSLPQAIFALCVFEELGLIALENGGVTVYRGVRADLRASTLYKKVCALQEGSDHE